MPHKGPPQQSTGFPLCPGNSSVGHILPVVGILLYLIQSKMFFWFLLIICCTKGKVSKPLSLGLWREVREATTGVIPLFKDFAIFPLPEWYLVGIEINT